MFAKIGSDLKKPDATTVIARENYKELLWKLPASDMLSIGRKTAEKLAKLNIRTIGDIANADVAMLKSHFGVVGVRMHNYANGEDSEGVREYVKSRKIESVGHGMTAVRDITALDDAKALVYYLSERIAARMRKYGVRGSGVTVDIRGNDLKHTSHQRKMRVPTYATREIAESAFALISEIWHGDPPLRTLTVAVYDLTPSDGAVQTTMFDDKPNEKEEALERAMDLIREKYGKDSIVRANTIGKDFIYDKTDAEDYLPFKR